MKGRIAAAAATAAMIVLGSGTGALRAETAVSPAPVVVELFTSQGCSSCPPADQFLGELAARTDVIALAFHVDYWDYIGWKDPYAMPAATARQRAYADTLGLHTVYTPQMVIDGRLDVVGSHRSGVEAAIGKATAQRKLALEITATAGHARVVVPAGKADERGEVLLVVFDSRRETPVKRGENAGRTLVEHNIVRDVLRLGTWTGEAATFEIELGPTMADHDGCAVLVQAAGQGTILGAALIPAAW